MILKRWKMKIKPSLKVNRKSDKAIERMNRACQVRAFTFSIINMVRSPWKCQCLFRYCKTSNKNIQLVLQHCCKTS